MMCCVSTAVVGGGSLGGHLELWALFLAASAVGILEGTLKSCGFGEDMASVCTGCIRVDMKDVGKFCEV